MDQHDKPLDLWRELLAKIDSGEIPILVEGANTMCVFCGNVMCDDGDPTDAHADSCIYVRAVRLVDGRLTQHNGIEYHVAELQQ